MSANRPVQESKPLVNIQKQKVYGLEGISKDAYEYVTTNYLQAIELELEGEDVVADINANWSCLTQYDLKSQSIVGNRKVINVFLEGHVEGIRPYSDYDPNRSGVFCFPRSLYRVLYDSFGKDVIFIRGSSMRTVVKAEDIIKKVAYKVLKRKLTLSKLKAIAYKVVTKLAPVVVSGLALSM